MIKTNPKKRGRPFGSKLSEETKKKMGLKGSKNPMWTGGIKITNDGYILIHKPNHPFNVDNYVFEHRLVVEKQIGRYLTRKERVHHINGIITDNIIENLMLFKHTGYHLSFHRWKKCNPKGIMFDGRSIKKKGLVKL